MPTAILGWILIIAAAITPYAMCAPASVPPEAPATLNERLAWQIALDREGFSPGVIDGKTGSKTHLATREFQAARGLPATGLLDQATIDALKVDPETAIGEHLVEASDLRGISPFTDDWNERAARSEMGYYNILDGLAERFHASKGLMQSLNAGVDFDSLTPGKPLRVPAIVEPTIASASTLRVDLKRKLIFALDSGDKPLAMFHCSIAASVEKRPSGKASVVVVVRRPDYTFDPAAWPEVKNVTRRLVIPPGARNPVGLAWVGLNLPGYGIHGTPQPEMIGKSGSHGCFRMTNWDAVRLSRMIRTEAVVTFLADGR